MVIRQIMVVARLLTPEPARQSPDGSSRMADGRSDGGQVAQLYMFYTYVLKSAVDNKLYIGYTEDLRKRLIEHNEGKTDSTEPRRPFELVYYEACLNKQKAIDREKYFKTGFGRNFLKSRI